MVKKAFILLGLLITLSSSAQKLKIYHDTWIDFNKNGVKDVYEDKIQPIKKRVQNLLSMMTMEEKTNQMVTLYGYGRVAKDEIPTDNWTNELWKDGLANIDEASNGVSPKAKYTGYNKHVWALNKIQEFFIEKTRLGIPVEFTNEGIRGLNHVKSTNFPAQIGMGATWNTDLLYKVGKVIGSEAYALGYNNIYSPVLDVARDQRWGRIVESFGEDPFLVSEYGVNISKGIQEEGVVNTLKHYAVYSAPKGGRDGHVRLDPHISWRDMHMMYMYPFKRAIMETNVMGVMSSYNDYDGIPVTGSHYFLTELLRNEYGFKGYVVSDSDAVAYLFSRHRVAETYKEAVRQSVAAGLNVRTTFNHPENFVKPLRELIKEGKLGMELIDKRVADVLYVKFQEGLFDKPYKSEKLAAKKVKTKANRAISLEASRQSLVLLKNENNILPLDKKRLKRVLVCGPTAKAESSSISRYGTLGIDVISGYEGIKSYLKGKVKVDYALGCELKDKNWPDSEVFDNELSSEEKSLMNKAVEKAKNSDVVFLFVGEDETCVGENLSRTSLELPGQQKKLLKALVETGKPVVVILINGHPLILNYGARKASAILEAWFPGEYGGTAIAKTLFGEYNPGGKLPVTIPRSVGQIPFNFPFKPYSQAGQAHDGPNGTGDSRVVTALYPFGYGLSYTSFEYSNLKIDNKLTTLDGEMKVTFTVKNTGKYKGDAVPQLYIHDNVSSVITYDWQLRGFDRIELNPGESKGVSFTVKPEHLQIIDRKMNYITEIGTFKLAIGESSEDIKLKGEFEIKK